MSKIRHKLWEKAFNLKTLFYAILLIVIVVSIQQYLLPDSNFFGRLRPHYNNYLIFKYSFKHLLANTNLYIFYPDEYGDLFKYSPTFAMFMGLFYYLPDWLGLIFWNLLNVIIFILAINSLPKINDKTKAIILLFVLLELVGNIQNEQSNTLIAGLIILSFVSFERNNLLLAALVIAISIYIKLFGIVALALFLLYPNKFRFLTYFLLWLVILWALPLVLISPDQLIGQYMSWTELLLNDHDTRYGFSVLGIMQKWFVLEPSKWIVMFTGVLLFCSVYIRKDLFADYGFRLLFLSSILIWIILFNYAAESCSYIICMSGIGIWYFIQERKTINTVLVIFAFIMISLIYTDITPAYYRQNFLLPYHVKTIPAIFIWLRILYEMLFKKYQIKATN